MKKILKNIVLLAITILLFIISLPFCLLLKDNGNKIHREDIEFITKFG